MSNKTFTSELISAGCDMSKLSKRALKSIEYIENINAPRSDSCQIPYGLTSMLDLAETRERYKAECKKMIRELEMKKCSLEEEAYKVKLREYFNDANYTSSCNCIIILEALTLEEEVEHDADYYRILRNMHDRLLNLISLQVL